MSALRERQPDQKQIVASLARESRVPVDVVAKLYERERAALAISAHITTFLHIFAMRNVQEVLRKEGADKLAAVRLPMPPLPSRSAAPAAATKLLPP